MKVMSVGLISLVLATAASPPATAGRGRAARRLAAYAATGAPIHAAVCPARAAHEARCALAFKHAAARRLCERFGRGRHDWYYVVGATAERRSAVALCL
jgi:hypothetical protein